MSNIRRWKSFSVKKTLGINELKLTQPSPKPRKKILTRKESVSMENVPLHLEIEKNDLFLRQKMKRGEEEEEEKPKAVFKRGKLKKRKSVSFDEARFSRCIEEFENVRLRQREDRPGHRYKTLDVLKKTDRKYQKSPIEVVRMNFGEHSELHRNHTNLTKSKSDWYINLISDDYNVKAAVIRRMWSGGREKKKLYFVAKSAKISAGTMWNRCVVEWLRDLRRRIEYYDEVLVVSDEMSDYENLWDCCENVKFGKVCRVSAAFDDCVENLKRSPVIYECLDAEDLDEDVIMWKKELRYTYCGEEENFLENEDLITDFQDEAKTSIESINKPGNFPLPEEEVQLRQSRTARIEGRTLRPKTLGSPVTKQKEDLLDFRGAVRLEIANDKCVKLRPRELLRLLDGNLQVVDDRGNVKITHRGNVILKKGAKLIGKREIEVSDTQKTIYRLFFETTKDAKFFLELEKSYHNCNAPSTSPFKNIGAWSQLRKLLKRRSSRDVLESKGIIRNEPIFGNTLEELCDAENPIPEVVTRLIELIEHPVNIRSVGLYRASANLAVVQNIRFEINSGRWDILEKHRNDVDVLAGTLKLFFRELKQPLVSYEVYQRLRGVIMNPSSNRDEISAIVDSLPRPNRETLLCIVRHLLQVCQHKEENKMDVHNMAICWGPSLITLPDSCHDIVLQTTEFTKITENLLSYYSESAQKLTDSPRTPDFVYEVVRKMTEMIEVHIEVEGIYRKSGSSAKIERIMRILEKHNLGDLDFYKSDIHELCCAFKKYIGTLRKSLVPDEFFQRYCEICDILDDSKLCDEVRRMVDDLPRRDVIFLLFEHLHKVVLDERKNKMSFGVLTQIWMTTLMAGANVQNYTKKMPLYTNLFLILLNLNEKALPDLVSEPKMRIYSKYDNVPDDIHSETETSNAKISTKL